MACILESWECHHDTRKKSKGAAETRSTQLKTTDLGWQYSALRTGFRKALKRPYYPESLVLHDF